MKAIIYIRVSTPRQVREGESLAVQEDRLMAYCKAKDFDVVEIIRDEGVTSKIPLAKRTGGKRLLAQVGPVIKNVVIFKFDRMFRNTLEALTTIAEFDKHGVSLHALDFGGAAIDTSSPLGKLMVTVRAGFAQMEREVNSERTRDAMQHKRRKGESLGQIPFGYTLDGPLITMHPDRPKVMAEILRLHEMGKGVRVIADIISADYGEPFLVSHNTVHRLIKKEFENAKAN